MLRWVGPFNNDIFFAWFNKTVLVPQADNVFINVFQKYSF